MKLYRIAVGFAFSLFASAAYAQQGTNISPGQTVGGSINPTYYMQNTDPIGFSEQSESYPIGVGTTQAGAGSVLTRTSVLSCSTGATAIILPALYRYVPLALLNRGTAACLIFPPIGAYLETALGTLGAVNASYSLAAGADVTFRPAIIGGQTEFLQ